jgi:branched-chain amino acid transport system ATP-binding protein
MSEPADVLVAQRLTRRFGGLTANQDVDLALRRGQLHALLGPNGAGKSTCINMLSGDLRPTSGRVLLDGRDITELPPHQRSMAGIGRSFQRTNVFPRFTAFENCRLAAQSRRQNAWRILTDVTTFADARERASAALARTGLAGRDDIAAGTLSHGEQRQLEIAMVLATGARVLLLDEPLAGMGAEESAQMVELLKSLRAAHAILLVEHDMEAVFALADVITVLVGGRVLASGAPDGIRANEDVQRAYLGQDEVLHV